MNSRRAKKLAAEAENSTDSPSKADFMHVSPIDASIRARFWTWLDDKFTKQDEYIKQQTELIKDMITEAKISLMGEIEQKFSSLKTEIVELAKNEIKNEIDDVAQRVAKLENLADEISCLRDEVKTLKSQIQRQENSLVASELRIN